jgi:hypothetical protein
MLISVQGTGKNQLEPDQESVWDTPVVSHSNLLKKIPEQNRLVCCSVVVKGKPKVSSPLFRALASNRISKVTNDITIHFFIPISNSCKLYQRNPGTFWSYYVLTHISTRIYIHTYKHTHTHTRSSIFHLTHSKYLKAAYYCHNKQRYFP